MSWHIKSTGTIAEIQAALNALVVDDAIEAQQFATVKEVFNNSVGLGSTTPNVVVPNTFLTGVTATEDSKLQLLAEGHMDGRISRVDYRLSVVKLDANGGIIGTVMSETFNTTTIAQGGGSGGDGTGILVGPNPEVADSINAQGDTFLAAFPGSNYTTLSFGNPVTVNSDVDISSSSLMTSLEFRLLETVGGNFDISSNDALTSFSAVALTTIGGNFDASGLALMPSLSLPELATVGGSFNISNWDALTLVSLPSLTTVGGPLSFTFDNALINLAFPILGTADDVSISSMAALESVSFPSLVVAGDVEIISCSLLTSLNLPLVTTFDSFACYSSLALVTLSLPSLTTCGDVQSADCTSLVTVTFPSVIFPDGVTINFNNCALSATSVQNILRRCVLSGLTTATIDLSGGTNAGTASLNAQGQADVATLGAQVTMNP